MAKVFEVLENRIPQLLIRKKGEDTCTDCLILRNKFPLLAPKRKTRKAAEDSDSGTSVMVRASEVTMILTEKKVTSNGPYLTSKRPVKTYHFTCSS